MNQERSDRNRQRVVNHSAGSQCEDVDRMNVASAIPVALAGALLVVDFAWAESEIYWLPRGRRHLRDDECPD